MRVIGSQERFRWGLFLAALTLFAASASATVTSTRGQQAVAAFDKAQQMHAALEAQPEGKRRKEDYKKVIDAYYEVSRLNPAYSKTPVALAAVAELYREMGREFSTDSYFLESIKSYRFLIDQYPHITISRARRFSPSGRFTARTLKIPTKPARPSRISSRCIPNPTRREKPRTS